ncbi:MAG: hypothetical protein MJ229_04685 [bacterium]|nr:hypothetical protein [bacterium]
MKKKLSFLNLSFITVAIFSTLAFAGVESLSVLNVAYAEQPQVTQQVPQQIVSDKKTEQVDDAPQSIPEKNINTLKNMDKNSTKYKVFKFFISMLGVVISVLAIYGGLKLYKTIISRASLFPKQPKYDNTLETPTDFKTAINMFLKKTE